MPRAQVREIQHRTGVDVFMILQEEEPEMFEQRPQRGDDSFYSIRARSAFLRCALRPAAPPSTRARLSLHSRRSHRPPSGRLIMHPCSF